METKSPIPHVPLKCCKYVASTKRMTLESEFFAGRFPPQFYVDSHRTGKSVLFTLLQPGDRDWDQDGWDGEQQVYKPVDQLNTVNRFTIYHTR